MDLYLTARFLHILLAATWFGLTVSGRQKAIWFAREDLQKAARPEIYLRRASVVGSFVGLSTIASGLWLISLTGGFEAVPWTISAGFGLAIAIVLIGALLVGRGWDRLAKRRAAGGKQCELEAIATQIGRWDRVIQILWVLALATMVFRFAF